MPQDVLARTQFEALADSAPDAIFTIDEQSVILFANRAVERVFGYRPEELVGQPLTRLMPERFRTAHDAGLARYLRTGRKNIPWTGVQLAGLRRDGREIPLEISFGEYADEDGRRVFSGFARDITERTLQQAELQHARLQAEQALREVAAVDRVMQLAMKRGSYDEMTPELIRGLRSELNADEATVLMVDDARSALQVHVADGIEPAATTFPLHEGLALRLAESPGAIAVEDVKSSDAADPALRREIASLLAAPLRVDGALIGVVHVGTRERRRFSRYDTRLLELVADRIAGVMARTRLFESERRARRDAEQATRLRDEVLSIVSHDLRNPVSTIMMSASLLADDSIPLTDEQRSRQLQIITRSAHRMSRLIQDLLDVARLEGGRFRMSCQCENAESIAQEAYEAFRKIAEEKGLALECDFGPALGYIMADRDRLIQVLSNLLNNAVKFVPRGGRVVLRAARTDGGVRFEVEDNGPGIAAEDLAHLFSRFWQKKRTAHLGAGLGLAIAKGIVDGHGGTIRVDSTEGQGARFAFEIPAGACA